MTTANKKSHALIWVGGAIVVFMFWRRIKHVTNPVYNLANNLPAIPAQTNGLPVVTGSGMPFNNIIQYGGKGESFTFINNQPPFNSTSTINVNVAPFNSLTEKFIPLYGFVGMAAR